MTNLLIDTHCHLSDPQYYTDNRDEVYAKTVQDGVVMVCASTDLETSQHAIQFSQSHPLAFPLVGVHPHESKKGWAGVRELVGAFRSQVIGIGEIGLDYYYGHSPKDVQIQALEAQIQIAIDYDLPISFHVRDAFDDFWPVVDNFKGIRGVLHSFTDTAQNAEKGFARNLLVGLNGISTFTKKSEQVDFYTSVPLERVLFETDAPYLTPAPFRGTMNIPAYVGSVARFHAHARGMSLESVSNTTTANAEVLFGVNFHERYNQQSTIFVSGATGGSVGPA